LNNIGTLTAFHYAFYSLNPFKYIAYHREGQEP